MTEDVIRELNKPGDQSKFHSAILQHGLALVKMSKSKMSKHYETWDMNDEVYRGIRTPDKEDMVQSVKGKPVKMVVPNTFAQAMTFTSFLFLMFKQNKTFFELTPTGDEDYGTKQQDMELVLEQNLRKNRWDTLLFQHLLDTARFGPGIIECCWTRDITRAYVEAEPVVATYSGVEIPVRQGSDWQEYVKYEGNLVRAVSPYRFFPDTRFPLVDFQRGEFCAAEEEYSKSSLRKLAKAGEVAGVDAIEALPNTSMEALRAGITRTTMGLDGVAKFLYGASKSEGTIIVTKMQVWIVPSKFEIEDNKKLGPEEFPILYHLWYANDNRVIRCEPAYWWHNKFGWTISHFTPDMHQTVNFGLADLIYRLQDVISWHINSRITDVRRNLRGRLLVDPSGVDTSTLDGDGDIYVRQVAAKAGMDRFVKQLAMNDVTQAHMSDAEILGKMMQVVTGVNDNLMGQYNSGRRSAQEARTVLGGASGRMKMHGHLIWSESLGPLGTMMLSNCRQSMSQEMFGRLIGGAPEEQGQRYAEFKGTPEEVICGDDYFQFDSTLASEKGFMAQSLQELLVAIISSDPTAAQRMSQGIDPVKLVEEIQYLRGSGSIRRFKYSPEEQQQIAAQQQAMLEAQNPQPAPTSNTSGHTMNVDRSVTLHVKPEGKNGAAKK
jgi:hypothetical protein